MSTASRETAIETTVPATSVTVAPSRARATWERIEAWLVRVGDRLNPILVKETRQAIKSRQFSLAFVLVLVAAWVITFGGIAIIGPTIFYSARGADMFWYYYWILSAPLAVVVPYGAYRSLAAEREDNTYELLSITTLTPRQIIAGKLASAFVQMLVYLSAVAPCLAFTYLLRGIDVLSIALLIVYAVLGSLGLSLIGLLLATAARQRYGQVVLSVAFVVGLVLSYFGAIGLAAAFIEESYQFLDDPWFWVGNAAFLTAYGTTFALLFLAAAAQITFKSDNRSTPLRIAMLFQQVCFLGWIGFAVLVDLNSFRRGGTGPGIGEAVWVTAMFAGAYWFILGTMMSAEWPVLSRRVQRNLPQSFLGRVFLTWFNPGPGTGFVFALANLTAIVLIGLWAVWVLPDWVGVTAVRFSSVKSVTYFLIIGLGYVVIFLGIGRLLIDLVRQFAAVPIAGAILLQAFLLSASCFVPWMVHLMSPRRRFDGYSLLHASNPFWSLGEIIDSSSPPAEADVLILLIPGLAFLVFVMNFGMIAREVRRQRVTLPARVAEDEAVLHPPDEPGPQSPWDLPEEPA